MKRSSVLALLVGFAAVLSLASCTTTINSVSFRPTDIATPVSASGFFIDASGNVIGPDRYKVVQRLRFDKEVPGPVNRETHAEIDLSDDFRKAAEQYGADAIVNVTISAIGFYQSSEKAIGLMRGVGTGLMIGGGVALIAGIATGDPSPLTVGAVFTGLGGATLLMTIPLSKTPTRWTIRIEGDAVKLLR